MDVSNEYYTVVGILCTVLDRRYTRQQRVLTEIDILVRQNASERLYPVEVGEV